MNRVAIVIVTHNSAAEIGGCLDALAGVEGVDVIVVDNASRDRTRDEVERRGVRLIANRENAGFAGGVNEGVRATSAPLVLLLNPDAHLMRGLEALEGRFDDPRTGAAGGMLVDAEGKPQAGFMARSLPSAGMLICEILGINRLWPGNPLNWKYRCKGLDPGTAAQVDQPAGAFLMFPRKLWEKLGGLDERFWPVWFEDVDFCARIRAAGFDVYYEPRAVAKHTGGHSVGSLSGRERQEYWYGSLLKYSEKHHGSGSYRMVCLAVVLGSLIRALRGVPREGAKALAVSGRVAGMSLNRLFGKR
jgi:GT2 family glycosyltransferase